MNKYVNQFRQVSTDHEGDIVNKVIGSKNLLEVGFCAGQLSVRFAEVVTNLTCIDSPNKFFSPSLQDHVRMNNISNIEYSIVEDIIKYVKDNYDRFDVIYIDESHNKIEGLVSFLEKKSENNLKIIYNNRRDITSDSDIKVVQCGKLSESKTTEEEDVTPTDKTVSPTPRKKSTKKPSKTATN